MIEIALSILIGCPALYFLFPMIVKRILRKRFLYAVKKTGYACLTFDDGPNPETTPAILELLKKAGVNATFFVTGENVEKYPDLADQIVAMGHEIGEHSFEHSHAWKTGPFRTANDLIRGNRAIEKYRSPDEKVSFRPPYGKLNIISLLYILLSGRRVVLWNVNPKDYDQESSESVLKHVTDRLFPGSVILLHEGSLPPSRVGKLTVSALRSILKEAAHRGLRLTTIGKIVREASKKDR